MVSFANNEDGILTPSIDIEPHPERIADLKAIFTDSACSSLEELVEASQQKEKVRS